MNKVYYTKVRYICFLFRNYMTPKKFEADFKLIVANCELYNASEAFVTKCSKTMIKKFYSRLVLLNKFIEILNIL